MNSKLKKIIVSVLCLSIVTGSAGVLALNSGNDNTESKVDTSAKTEETKKTNSDSDDKISKEETVYVMTKADGSINKIIVSDWIKNATKEKTIADRTNLENIKNVKGDQKYTMDSDGARVWDADGNDIYYEGSIDKELPVDVAISYQLDGEDISAEDLAGKSGKVTMRFDYDNRQYEEKVINGVKTKIYVPYVMLTGTILDNDIFSNVKISNGKIINDGDKTIVVGFAMPGMQENLNINKSDLDIPEYVEITADVKDFELSTTLSVATNEMFNEIDSDKATDKVDELTDSIDELTDAMDQLLDGSSKLYDGVSTLLDKSSDLIKGIKTLSKGAGKLKNGSKDLKNGSSQLYSGINSLYSGLGQLKANNNELNQGAKTVFETLLKAANEQIATSGLSVDKLTISNYSSVLDKAIDSLSEAKIRAYATSQAKTKVTETVNAQKGTIKTQVEVAVREEVLKGVLQKLGYTYDQYKQAVEAGLIDTTTQAQIDGAVEQQMNSSAIKSKIDSTTDSKINELIEQNMNSADVKAQIETAVNTAKNGASSLKGLKAQLDSYNKFYKGLGQYTDGVSSAYSGAYQLKNGAYQLKNGSSQLANGTVQLYNGITTLKNGSGKLVNGVKQLKDGSMQLSDGLKEFNEKGIKKITDAINGDVKDVYERVKATIDVSKNYKSFGGIPDDMDGISRFVFKTDSIEK